VFDKILLAVDDSEHALHDPNLQRTIDIRLNEGENMGSRGLGRIAVALLDSSTPKVFSKLLCPALIVQ